jgi:hypothetical protein
MQAPFYVCPLADDERDALTKGLLRSPKVAKGRFM